MIDARMINGKLWLILAVSCSDCNKMTVQILDHAPTELEKKQVKEECGGMYCIRLVTAELKVGEMKNIEQHD